MAESLDSTNNGSVAPRVNGQPSDVAVATRGTPLLQLQNVCVDYGKFRALTDVGYTIYPGQVVALLGGNASGKSTSMKTISGTAAVTSGEIRWKGEMITHEPTPKRMARGIGVVPEGRRMFASLTVLENLQVGAWAGKNGRATSDDIAAMLDLFPPLKNLIHRPSGVLSGGEQQMVAFARALIKQPDLVIMDEPSMGLAPTLVKRVFEIIKQIKDRRVAVFIVEQNARAALRIADYAYVLASGAVVLEGTPDKVANDPSMTEAYLGRRH